MIKAAVKLLKSTESIAGVFHEIGSAVTSKNLGRFRLKENHNPGEIINSELTPTKNEFLKIAKAKVIRTQFKHHVNNELVRHIATRSMRDEVGKAKLVRNELLQAATATLGHDFMQSDIHHSIDITKEAIAEVVDSISRNPEAIQLVNKIQKLDNLSYQHAIEVSLMMIAFGRELCLSNQDLVEVGVGGLLHDIGESKPIDHARSVRNITKFKLYKEHVAAGLAIANQLQHSSIVKQIIQNHHEYYDGSGYPNGRKKGQIGLYGNMVIIVDSYASLVSGRCCDKPLTPSAAIGVMNACRGTKFHPQMLDQFIQMIGMYPVGAKVKLSTGDIGVVIKQNKQWKMKPVVVVLIDSKGKELLSPIHVDLQLISDSNAITIIKEIAHTSNTFAIDDYFKVTHD